VRTASAGETVKSGASEGLEVTSVVQGAAKKGWYRGYWCDSTYELLFVIYTLDHEIELERNLEVFPYEFEGRLQRWIPDFRLAETVVTLR